MSDPVSVQLYSVRDAIGADRPGTLARLRAIGLTSVEPYAFANDPVALRADLDAAGLTASSGHNSLIGVDDAELVLEAAATVGIPVAIEPAVRDVWDDADAIKRMAAELSGLAEKAASFGVRIGYHNHWWEFETAVGDGTGYDVFLDEVSRDVVLELDTYWATVGGQDAAALLQRLGDRVGFIHVKDGTLEGDPVQTQVPVGTGEVPVTAILAAAPHAVRVLEFDQYSGDLFQGLADGLAFVQKADGE